MGLPIRSRESKELVSYQEMEGKHALDHSASMNKSNTHKVTIIISLFAFTAPMSSSMSAPALDIISKELNISPGLQTNLIMSIFLLAYSLGPFVLSPCSEIWGRKRIVQTGNVVFLLFNTACGFSRNGVELVLFRFLAGVGGSASVGVSVPRVSR